MRDLIESDLIIQEEVLSPDERYMKKLEARIEHLEAALKHIGNAAWILEDGSADINVMDYANDALK